MRSTTEFLRSNSTHPLDEKSARDSLVIRADLAGDLKGWLERRFPQAESTDISLGKSSPLPCISLFLRVALSANSVRVDRSSRISQPLSFRRSLQF